MLPPKTVVTRDRASILSPLFEGLWLPPIIRPAIFGDFGLACVDKLERPTVCSLALSDFVMFGGDAGGETARYFVTTTDPPYYLLPSTEAWLQVVRAETHTDGKLLVRSDFSSAALRRTTAERLTQTLPRGYELRRFDEAALYAAASQRWSQSFVENFPSAASFLDRGVGFGVFTGGKLVSGATSFAREGKTVEIEVDTHPRFRRRGLATIAAARLVLYCLDNDLVPHWDAANKPSRALAAKLGFTLERDYEVLEV